MLPPTEPPFILDSARVVVYAETGGTSTYTGRVTISTGYGGDLRDIGPVPHIAICEDLGTGRMLVMHCDRGWHVLGVCRAATVEAAKELCERGYAGISSRWISFRELSPEESAEVESDRLTMQQMVRDHPLDGHDPFAA
jgi:hypothetical protein